jgi:hypothetical protein
MNLVKQLRDIAEMGVSDEDCLMLEAADQIEKLREALMRIRDTPHVVYEPVRQIALEALE